MSNTEPNIIAENDYYSQLLESERLLNEYAEKGDYKKAEIYKKKINKKKEKERFRKKTINRK